MTKIIIDSKNIDNFEKMPGMVDTKWDNLEEFNKNKDKQQDNSRKTSKDQEIVIPTTVWTAVGMFANNYFANYTNKFFNTDLSPKIQPKKKNQPTVVESQNGHSKKFVSSIGILILLLLLSPNTRKWSKTLILFALYSGSIGTLIYT